MNIFEQYGIKEVADVCLYAIELDENDDEIYVPVLYMDTLKVSTVEESTQTTSAQGGIGNPKLITWDYGKDITVTLEDALFTPASSSMNWAGKLCAKGLQLQLRYFFDRNTDNNVPDTCLRTGILTAEKFSDFLIIPDRWPVYEGIQCKCSKKDEGYVGGTSIYCWMISGHISSNDGKKRVNFEDLILFYREATQRWYFFNGQGPTNDPETWWKTPYKHEPTPEIRVVSYDKEYFPIYYQYGKEVFEWIREHIAKNTAAVDYGEYEPIARATIAYWLGDDISIPEDDGIFFLTQNLYIDGYRKMCAKDKRYSEITDAEVQRIYINKYMPYRYFANVGVEYNTNVSPPQDAIYSIDTALEDVYLHERIEKHIANRTFCIDADENMKHSQYRYLEKYSETPLTVFIDPRTMEPFLPNASQFHRQNGQKITGNLTIIQKGKPYLKWIREKAKENTSLGKQLIIDPIHYPGCYRLVGETTIRDRLGIDQPYQFEIPLCKLSATNKLLLQADGEPTTFTMKLTALRRNDGVMMKLTSYNLTTNSCPCGAEESAIEPFTSAEGEAMVKPYTGGIDPHLEITMDAHTPRDFADVMLNGEVVNGENQSDNIGFFKTRQWTENPQDEGVQMSEVVAKISGYIDLYSIDGTLYDGQIYNDTIAPKDYTATIIGSESR